MTLALTDPELEPFRLGVARVSGDVAGRRPLGEWVARRLRETLYQKQRDIAASIVANRRTAVAACFDSGKSFLASRAACWWLDTHPPGEALVVTTATTFAQVRGILWQEIGSAHKANHLPGKVNQTEWWINDRLVGFGRRPRDWSPDAFTGYHRPYVLVIVDEASGVPKAIFEALEGLITNADSRVLAIGNPYAADSHFASLFAPGSIWNGITISAFDTPAWTGETVPDVAVKSLISPVWVDELRAMLGDQYEATAMWQTKVLARFPDESDDQLISLAHVIDAQHHDHPKEGPPTIGVDVARYGEDESVIACRWGWHVEILETFRGKPTTHTAGRVMHWVRELACRDVRVDDDGIGGGVTDILRENGVTVDALRNGAQATDPTRFVNARSEWWWHLRQAFIDREPDLPPDDQVLAAQLTAIRFDVDSKGRYKVESKKDMRARGAPSPDRADAVLYTTASGRTIAPVVAPISTRQASHVRQMTS